MKSSPPSVCVQKDLFKIEKFDNLVIHDTLNYHDTHCLKETLNHRSFRKVLFSLCFILVVSSIKKLQFTSQILVSF